VIGIVVADSEMRAKLAAGRVKVEYEELPAIIDMHQAIEAKSFIKGTERTLQVGAQTDCKICPEGGVKWVKDRQKSS
jgi:xanthine dehydrogenase/oxidase